jgi:hypothetical protein
VGAGQGKAGLGVSPEVKSPPPEKDRQPFTVQVVVLAYNKGDAAQQVRKAVERLGGTVLGSGVSSQVKGIAQ